METLSEIIIKAIEKYHVKFMKKKVLKTVEEVEANTDAADKYIAGAGVADELINKLMFPDGTAFYLDTHDGIRGYNTEATRGADTFSPFSNYNVKASAAGRTASGSSGSSISITVPKSVKRGLLLCVSTGWASELTQNQPSGSGIKKIVSKHNRTISGVCSNITAIYNS